MTLLYLLLRFDIDKVGDDVARRGRRGELVFSLRIYIRIYENADSAVGQAEIYRRSEFDSV